MTDPRLDGRTRQRRDIGRLDAQESEIAARVSPNELRSDASAVRETNLELLVPLHDVVGRSDEPVCGPDDPTCRVAAATVDRDDGRPGAFDGASKLVRDT